MEMKRLLTVRVRDRHSARDVRLLITEALSTERNMALNSIPAARLFLRTLSHKPHPRDYPTIDSQERFRLTSASQNPQPLKPQNSMSIKKVSLLSPLLSIW